MPDAVTMTPPQAFVKAQPSKPVRGIPRDRLRGPHFILGNDSEQSSSGSSSSRARTRKAPERQARPSTPQHTVHINIGRVEVPRSLPPVRSMGTQTDESSVEEMQQAARDKEAARLIEHGRLHNRFKRFGKKYLWPAVVFASKVFVFCAGRVGVGFRIN